MSLAGSLVQTLSSGKYKGGDFVACAVSGQGGWVHALGDDSQLYCFDVAEGKLQHDLRAHEKDVIGMAMHPHRNIVATWADDGTLRVWRAE